MSLDARRAVVFDVVLALALAALSLSIYSPFRLASWTHAVGYPLLLAHAVLGAGLGMALRNQTAAVAVALLWNTGIEQIGLDIVRLPELARWLPAGAADALAKAAPASPSTLAMWAAAIVFTTYAAALGLAGAWRTVAGDVE